MNILLICLLNLSVFAIPEWGYEAVWKNEVLASLDSTPASFLINKQGKKVAYRSYLRGPGLPNIVISPGRQEPMKKYYELVHDIQDANFYLIDHQGQGESERLLKDSHKGHVIAFQDYVNDFSLWMSSHVIPGTIGKPLYLIAHSIGAAIAVRTFRQTILYSPVSSVIPKFA
jgi:alpha-beta hydrolase superfamily lysophospholipase